MSRRARMALTALAVLALVTVSWWMLALWPLPGATPAWVGRTRAVCFGVRPDGLPDASGWVLLIGQPMGMLLVLLAGWGSDLRDGFRALAHRSTGRLLLGGSALMLLTGLTAAVARVSQGSTGGEPFDVIREDDPSRLARQGRVDDVAPSLRLVNQRGDTVDLAVYSDRTVLVTFAFGHCETVCPLTVQNLREARARLGPEERPVLLVLTLDPWRDTPSRLANIAEQWGLTDDDAHLLGGDIATVERTLTRWRIPGVRNPVTGDITHPSVVYIVRPGGRLSHALGGGETEVVLAALRG